jgi:precorrin-6Y C5,15-methyltransferase (decarboxylating)
MKTVYLVGVGMGNPQTLTQEGKAAICASGLLIGAKRLLEPFRDLPVQLEEQFLPDAIAQIISAFPGETVSVLLSGDPGFYSGAARLYQTLTDCKIVTIPGISSLNYFCARLQTTWQDVKLVSAHGREHNGVGEIQSHAKTFLLTGGTCRVEQICQQLTQRGLGELTVYVGERLSYPDERILTGTAEEWSHETFADLSVMLVENPNPIPQTPITVGISDDRFVRGNVPMTKESVRTAAVSKLNLEPHHTVWDVGAGTGSVSVACALAARKGTVYAIEKNPQGINLLEQNKKAFGVTNLQIVPGTAPDVLAELPAPDRVFIGGSSGRIREIFAAIRTKNPAARIVVTAATLESLTDAIQCWKEFGAGYPDVTQLTAAESRPLGQYHMMTGQNPVWILSGEGLQ